MSSISCRFLFTDAADDDNNDDYDDDDGDDDDDDDNDDNDDELILGKRCRVPNPSPPDGTNSRSLRLRPLSVPPSKKW